MKETTSPNSTKIAKAEKFYKDKIRTLEIVTDNGEHRKMRKIYFAKPPFTKYHSVYSKEKFNNGVLRNNPNDKIEGLMAYIPYMDIEVTHFAKISKVRCLGVNLTLFYLLQRITYMLAIVVNVCLGAFGEDNFGGFSGLGSSDKMLYFAVLGVMILYLFMLIIWYFFYFDISLEFFKLDYET